MRLPVASEVSLTLAAVALLACGASRAPEPTLGRAANAPSAAASTPEPAAGTPTPAEWLTSDHPDLRRLTVVVKVEPPAELAKKYRELAQRHRKLEPFFLAQAALSFGSGFVMVRRTPGEPAPSVFVVTNRHVVGLSSEATVRFEDGGSFAATVIDVDDAYDLAILSLGAASAKLPVESGFGLEPKPAKDQDAVVASGYPGIGQTPSYQVTRGYVSNERFLLNDGGDDQLYLQHTAPIDAGSSGGPLTTDSGKVLGVNTLKIRNRENFGLAVPAAAVEKALARVANAPQRDAATAEVVEAGALSACEALTRSARGGPGEAVVLERAIGARSVAEHGLASLDALPRDGEWRERFFDHPTEVFLRAIAVRLQQVAQREAGKASASPSCVPSQSPPYGFVEAFRVEFGGVERVLSFAREQSRWKLVHGAFALPKASSLLDDFDRPRTPPPKWKPTLK